MKGIALAEKQFIPTKVPIMKMPVIKVDIQSGRVLYDRLKEVQRAERCRSIG